MEVAPGVELTGWLGAGATATVYAGRWTSDGATRDVAVKLARGGDEVLRTAAETAALDHPNIVAVLGFGRTSAPWEEYPEGTPYLVMERVAAANLGGRAGAGEELGFAAVRAVLEALVHVHGRGLLHGDISPGNVLVSDDGARFWLTDFGGPGTEGFKAPERDAGPSVASDLYSVGALGRFLSGRDDSRFDALLAEDPAARPPTAAATLAGWRAG